MPASAAPIPVRDWPMTPILSGSAEGVESAPEPSVLLVLSAPAPSAPEAGGGATAAVVPMALLTLAMYCGVVFEPSLASPASAFGRPLNHEDVTSSRLPYFL